MGVDPLTGTRYPLFNLRLSDWKDHFAFTDDGLGIADISPERCATVDRLGMNRPPYRQQRENLRLAAQSGSSPIPSRLLARALFERGHLL